MPQLLSCPNEVLLQLIRDLSYGGLESFALTCKRAFGLSAEAIAEKKEKYSTITCGHIQNNNGVNGVHPFFTLREVLLDDAIAIYPTKMLIGSCSTFQYVESWGIGLDSNLEDEYYRDAIQIVEQVSQQAFELEDLIVSTLEKYSSIFDDSDEFHNERIMNGKTGAAIGLLIMMLPNLRLIEFFSSPPNCPTLTRILSKISNTLSSLSTSDSGSDSAGRSQLKDRNIECGQKAETSVDASEVMKGFQALGNLRQLKVVGRGIDLNSVAPFLKLAHLRIFSGTNIFGNLVSDFGRFSTELNTSAITRIEFEDSAICSRDILGLLGNVTSLEHFKYSYSAGAMNGPLWLPSEFIWSLSRYYKHSLRSLDLTDCRGMGATLRDTGCICYLKEFQVLHSIRLDNMVFVAERRTICMHSREITSSAADYLPATMETLTLARPFGKGVAHELLGDFPQQKKSKFPRLREIVFEEKPGLEEELEKDLRHAGIMLRLPNEGETSEGGVANEPDSSDGLAEAVKDISI